MYWEFAEIEQRIISLAHAFIRRLPNEDIEMTLSLVRAGEYGVALEGLATQLIEYDVEVTLAQYREIEELGGAMGLDDHYWTMLTIADEA